MPEEFAPLKPKHTAPLPPDKPTKVELQDEPSSGANQSRKMPIDNDEPQNGSTPRSIVATAQDDKTDVTCNQEKHKEGLNSKQSRWKNIKKMMLFSPRQRRRYRKGRGEISNSQALEKEQNSASQPKRPPFSCGRAFPMAETPIRETTQEQDSKTEETANCEVVEQTHLSQKIGPSSEFRGAEFPKKVVSNRGTFPWRRNMAPQISQNVKKGVDAAKDSRDMDKGQKSFNLMPEKGQAKNHERHRQTEEAISEMTRTKTRRLQNFKQRIHIPSLRSGRDVRQQEGSSQANVDDMAGLARSAISVPFISEDQLSGNSEKDQTRSWRHRNKRTSHGHNNQGSQFGGQSPRYVSLRSWGNNRKRATEEGDDLDSPWGVKGDVSSGSETMSRQLSRSFFESVDNALLHVGDIVTAINQGLKPKKQATRESGLSDSQEGTVDQSGHEESKTDGEAIEMLRDAFVEYTTRARQSSNRTFASMLRRKSAIL